MFTTGDEPIPQVSVVLVLLPLHRCPLHRSVPLGQDPNQAWRVSRTGPRPRMKMTSQKMWKTIKKTTCYIKVLELSDEDVSLVIPDDETKMPEPNSYQVKCNNMPNSMSNDTPEKGTWKGQSTRHMSEYVFEQYYTSNSDIRQVISDTCWPKVSEHVGWRATTHVRWFIGRPSTWMVRFHIRLSYRKYGSSHVNAELSLYMAL